MEGVNEPVYLITLRTERDGRSGEDVLFSASADQLQDMVNRLRECAKNLRPDDEERAKSKQRS